MLEFLFNKVADLQVYYFMKKRLQHRCFPVNIARFDPFLCTVYAFFNYDNLAGFFSVKICYTEKKKSTILSKSKNSIIIRIIQLFSGDQLLPLSLTLYFLLT